MCQHPNSVFQVIYINLIELTHLKKESVLPAKAGI